MLMRWLLGDRGVVPVVMFHSVGGERLDWEYRHIAEPVEVFEQKIEWLVKAGFKFLVWDELYAYMQGQSRIDTPAVMLTFDDGYLDNWVYVYPILKKYGAKGTIFVSPDFVDPSETVRPNAEDLARGLCKPEDLRVDGFLNWEEMRRMEHSGHIDIQSHAKSHTWYFSSPTVVDYWKPGQREHSWMSWNERPERKPYYLRETQWDYIEPGTPVYEHEKALCVRRFFPAQEVAFQMAEYVRNNGGEEFFSSPDAMARLDILHNRLMDRYRDGCRYETSSERRARTVEELSVGKLEIERRLDKRVDFICWPGGGYDRLTLDVAREVGFKAWTLGSKDQSSFRNSHGVGGEKVKRVGSSTYQSWRGRQLGYTSGLEFLCLMHRHRGSALHKMLFRILKAGRIMLGSRAATGPRI